MNSDKSSHFSLYLSYITPTPGDPTYSVLRAHLLFEEMLWTHLDRKLPNPAALKGARLTFSQILAIVRANTEASANAWEWVALGKLNKIRNLLSHESRPKLLPKKIDEYVQFYVRHSEVPLPAPDVGSPEGKRLASPAYLAVDLVTVALYYRVAILLGFSGEGAFGGTLAQGADGAG